MRSKSAGDSWLTGFAGGLRRHQVQEVIRDYTREYQVLRKPTGQTGTTVRTWYRGRSDTFPTATEV
jgi:hypothetical protein